MFRRPTLFPLTFILLFGGCAYFFPSCATIPGCPDAQVLCTNLNCSDPFTDPFNCGGCAEDGGQICAAGMICVPDGGLDGSPGCGCGAVGETMINGRCYALLIDSENCGAKGNACQTNHICVDGGCACAGPEYLDGGIQIECPVDAGVTVCAELRSDPENCGSCGSACPGDCVQGECFDGGTAAQPDGGPDAGLDAGIDGGVDAGLPDGGDGG